MTIKRILVAVNSPTGPDAAFERALTLANAQVIEKRGSAWIGAAQLLYARIAIAEGDGAAARRHLALADEQFSDSLDPGHRWRQAVESLGRGI